MATLKFGASTPLRVIWVIALSPALFIVKVPTLPPSAKSSAIVAVESASVGTTSATSVIVMTILWESLLLPSVTVAVNVYEVLVSKSGATLKVTTPVRAFMLKLSASVPLIP